jgi:hypothetical protein
VDKSISLLIGMPLLQARRSSPVEKEGIIQREALSEGIVIILPHEVVRPFEEV